MEEVKEEADELKNTYENGLNKLRVKKKAIWQKHKQEKRKNDEILEREKKKKTCRNITGQISNQLTKITKITKTTLT